MITSRDILGFSVAPNVRRIMEINGFYASIMRAEKNSDDNGKLPPGIPIPVLPVDCLKSRPNFWVGGQGSYVCPVESNWALWFNWTMNKDDIAILSSVKGMNPITGQRVNGLSLESYNDKCPVHNETFSHGKLCQKCGFQWPSQNYVSDPNPMYWDGFRTPDGHVRQFYFTEDLLKSVPEQVIGKDDTVPAFGFCFYEPKDAEAQEYAEGHRYKNEFPKGLNEQRGSHLFIHSAGSIGLGSSSPDLSAHDESICVYSCSSDMSLMADSCSSDMSLMADSVKLSSAEIKTSGGIITPDLTLTRTRTRTKRKSDTKYLGAFESRKVNAEVGIGAGAKMRQELRRGLRSVDQWNNKPAGIVRIYFVFREQFENYVQAGLNDLTGHKEGFMDSILVGGSK